MDERKWYSIKTPEGNLWWIAHTEWDSWLKFFTYPNQKGEHVPHILPLGTAIDAYESIGYKCIELELKELRVMPLQKEKYTKKDPTEDEG